MLSSATQNRNQIAGHYDDHSEQLANALAGPLSTQQGNTAEAAQNSFKGGRDKSREIADKNATKGSAYAKAHQALADLRAELRTVAHDGNQDIAKIESSKLDPATKLTLISQRVIAGQTQAGQKSGEKAQDISQGIQELLRQEGIDMSAYDFMKSQGFDLSGAFGSPNEEAVTNQVKAMMDGPKQAPGQLGGAGDGGAPDGVMNFSNTQSNMTTGSNPSAGSTGPSPDSVAHVSGVQSGPSSPTSITPRPDTVGGIAPIQAIPPGALPTQAGAPRVSTPSLTPATGGVTSTLPSTGLSTGGMGTGGLGSGLSAPGLEANTPSFQPITPQQLAENFNNGFQAGAPMSAGVEALSQNAIQPHVAPQPDFAHAASYSPSTTPTAGGLFATETAQSYAPAPIAPADTTATPAAAPAMYTAAPLGAGAPAAAAPAGPLPAYGSDLRPTASAAAPAGPTPVMPTQTMPTSAAPTTAAAGGVNPTVVQKAAAPTPAPTTPTGLTESAVAATTMGATTGAAAAQRAKLDRLRTVVEAVARQQPRLRWAAGERDDGTMVLVTDLAHGWIPPHIEIPAGVRLLPPAKRRNGLEHLLHDCETIDTWTPGQFLQTDKDAAPVSMSLRARDLPDVDDLNWELTQATNWRDGLPRLAHTLAKAGIAGTGILDSESDLLTEHLTAISEKVLKSYPDAVEVAVVGNWQLLAAIAALINGEKTALNYHFAWFQALTTPGGK